jgi:hypothetical protein
LTSSIGCSWGPLSFRVQVYSRPTGTPKRLDTSTAECPLSYICLTASDLNSAAYLVRFINTPSTHY